MVAKGNQSRTSPDNSLYGTLTDGGGNLTVISKITGSAKQATGNTAPDGSKYLVLTDGNGTMV